MKFERPKGILRLPKGYNVKTFNEIYKKEFEERTRFLDVTLSIERAIDEFIGRMFTDKMHKYLEIEFFILEKITFDQKILILESILKKEDLFKENPHFEKINEHEIKIKNFNIRINNFLQEIREIKTVRNHSVHKHGPIFGDKTIHLRSDKKRMKFSKYDKEDMLILAHFILWVLNLACKDYNINQPVLVEYYRKYQGLLEKIAKIEE